MGVFSGVKGRRQTYKETLRETQNQGVLVIICNSNRQGNIIIMITQLLNVYFMPGTSLKASYVVSPGTVGVGQYGAPYFMNGELEASRAWKSYSRGHS